jgi:hypothetical protein
MCVYFIYNFFMLSVTISNFTNYFGHNSQYLQMDLNKKFQEAASSHAIKISSMEVEWKCSIIKGERVTTNFGLAVLWSIKESPVV